MSTDIDVGRLNDLTPVVRFWRNVEEGDEFHIIMRNCNSHVFRVAYRIARVLRRDGIALVHAANGSEVVDPNVFDCVELQEVRHA